MPGSWRHTAIRCALRANARARSAPTVRKTNTVSSSTAPAGCRYASGVEPAGRAASTIQTANVAGSSAACRQASASAARRLDGSTVTVRESRFPGWPSPAVTFDPTDRAFIADPYPALASLREAAAVHHDASLRRYFVTRHAEVRACLRDRRLGRNFRHVGSEGEFNAKPLDPRWQDFWDVERWSLLFIEPPDHTRIRKLVASAFTPRAVEAMREPARQLAHELLDRCLERGRFDLLYDFAQPYSITLICRLLGVPTDRQRDLLDWSHRHVKMYEFDTTEEQALSAARAASEFRAYVLELIEERRRSPRDDMISALVAARIDGDDLSDDEIGSTVVVLLNAGHEATLNTHSNGVRALLRRPEEWRRLVSGEVASATAVDELIRFDPPL